jgi:hypothetical protein
MHYYYYETSLLQEGSQQKVGMVNSIDASELFIHRFPARSVWEEVINVWAKCVLSVEEYKNQGVSAHHQSNKGKLVSDTKAPVPFYYDTGRYY